MPSAITNTTYSFNAVPLNEEVTHVTNVNDNKNLTGKYAIYTPYPTYLDRSTLYMKHGDTINVPITNPSGGAIAFVSGNAAAGTARQQYPVPTSTSTTSGGTFSLTWPSNLADNNPQTSGNNTSFTNDTQWPFLGFPYSSGNSYSGSNVVSGSGGIAGVLRPGYKYSRKIRLSIVTGQIGFDIGETKTITEGHNSINIFSGSSITGLNKVIHNNTNSPSGSTSFANKLYLSVWNSSGTAKFTNSTVSGKWGLGSAWLGFISDSNPTVSLNTASLVPGTYRIYLNHYSGATASPTPGDRRVATDSRLYYITLTVNSAADTVPDAFSGSMGTLTYTGLATSGVVESSVATLTGTNQAAPISISGSGGFSVPQYRYRANSSSAFTSYTNTTGSIPAGYQFQFKVSTSSAASTQSTGTLNIGGVSATMSLTTAAAGSSGTGGGPAGTGNFGVEVRNASGVITFSPSRRTTSFVAASSGTFSLNAGVTSSSFSAEGITSTNATDIAILINVGGTQSSFQVTSLVVTRGTNQFTIKNSGNSNLSNISWVVVRY